MKSDIKKRTYKIVIFPDANKRGFTIEKSDLFTAFYCFRDCINSGLLECVMFRTETKYKCGVEISDPVLKFENNAIKNLSNEPNYYFKAFKRYLDTYGTTKQHNFIV